MFSFGYALLNEALCNLSLQRQIWKQHAAHFHPTNDRQPSNKLQFLKSLKLLKNILTRFLAGVIVIHALQSSMIFIFCKIQKQLLLFSYVI
jgi:hypothetical protein